METTDLVLLGLGTTLFLSLAIGYWGRRKSSGSLVSFFWGDNSLSVAQGAQLNLSTSFAINGVLYSAWLGYKAGWASILPQVLWCAGFLLLGRYAKRLSHLARNGTLHGNIGFLFGHSAARWAALASIIGFTLLFGWELYIGASILQSTIPPTNIPPPIPYDYLIYFALAAIAAIYCMIGGLRGNLYANQFQNWLGAVALTVAVIYMCLFVPSIQPFRWSDLWDTSTLTSLLSELTIAGLLANTVLFLTYQFVDMSVWQNIAAVSEDGNKPKRTLFASAFWIFLFPGVSGSALGMLMRSFTTGIDSNNILTQVLAQLSGHPWLLFFLICAFFAMMLSTVDGLLLAACQAFTWDLVDRRRVLRVLAARESAIFDLRDIDLDSLRSNISAKRLSLSGFLQQRLRPSVWECLSEKQTLPNKQSIELLEDLNRILSSENLAKDSDFSKIEFSPQTVAFAGSNPTSEKLVLLNRWILEEAFPTVFKFNRFSRTFRSEPTLSIPSGPKSEREIQAIENRVLIHARYAIFITAIIGGLATIYLVKQFGVNSFNLLYVTYVAQMALFPAVFVLLRGELRPQKRGALSIGLGLVGGYSAAIYGLVTGSPLSLWAPVVAIAISSLIYWPFRRISKPY